MYEGDGPILNDAYQWNIINRGNYSDLVFNINQCDKTWSRLYMNLKAKFVRKVNGVSSTLERHCVFCQPRPFITKEESVNSCINRIDKITCRQKIRRGIIIAIVWLLHYPAAIPMHQD